MRRSVLLPSIAVGGLILGACGGAAAPPTATTSVRSALRPTTQSVSIPPTGAALATACVATLSQAQPRAGSTDTLRISSAPPNATVRVMVIVAGRRTRYLSATTDGSGSAELPFGVGRPPGTVPVDLIATVAATADCATSYTVVP